jgi:hypothetical protein
VLGIIYVYGEIKKFSSKPLFRKASVLTLMLWKDE